MIQVSRMGQNAHLLVRCVSSLDTSLAVPGGSESFGFTGRREGFPLPSRIGFSRFAVGWKLLGAQLFWEGGARLFMQSHNPPDGLQ